MKDLALFFWINWAATSIGGIIIMLIISMLCDMYDRGVLKINTPPVFCWAKRKVKKVAHTFRRPIW